MTRTVDNDKLTRALQGKLTSEEERQALEQYAKEHPRSTLLKPDKTAKYIDLERLRETGHTPANWSEIKTHTEDAGRVDWTPPDLRKPPPKQPSAKLWNALEQFVQLSDKGLDCFKADYPGFLPTWFCTLPVEGNTGLLAWWAWRNLLLQAWHAGFHPEYVAQLVNIPTMPPGNSQFDVQPVFDAQRAVLQMMLESWRARFCPKCGRPFVAREPRDTYWPEQCFDEQRREKQRAAKRYRRQKRTKSSRRSKA
jgi:hypothetical protein